MAFCREKNQKLLFQVGSIINNEKKENELFMTDNRQRNNGKREEEK